MIIKTKHIGLPLFIVSLAAMLFGSCSKESALSERVAVDIRVQTRVPDNNVLNNDDKVNSIAVYVFSGTSQYAEWSYFQTGITALSSTSGQGYDWDTQVSLFPGDKTVYVFVNYDKVTLNATLDKSTNRAQLEALTVNNTASFVPNELFMAGKTTQTIGAAATQYIAVNPARLASRVDIYPYKHSSISSKVVVLKKITLVNQLKESKVLYNTTGNAMVASPVFSTEEKSFDYTLTNSILPANVNYSALNKLDSKGNLYSYCNIVPASPSSADLAKAAKLQLDVTIDGIPKRYEGYITDNNQVDNKYSLSQNAIYRVVAIFSVSDVTLTYTVAGWSSQVITIPAFQ